MLEVDSITKLTTSVIFVAGTGGALEGPGLLLGTEIVGLSRIIEGPEPRQSLDGLVLSSMRNQLTVTISPSRLVFVDASGDAPARTDFSARVAQAAEHIGRQSDQTYSAVGLNFEIELEPDDQELPSRAMLFRFIKEDALAGTGYQAVGASARLWYAAHDRLHELRIEPRGNQYDGRGYFAYLNVHMVLQGEAPSAGWLSQALNEEYREFLRVLTDVLETGERQ